MFHKSVPALAEWRIDFFLCIGLGIERGVCSESRVVLYFMHCPFCQNPDTKVVDTRVGEDGYAIRRRRECPKCGKRFTTVETAQLLVIKRSGNSEPFDRDKVISGVRKACQGRPIDENALKRLGRKVEEDLRSRGLAQVDSDEVGRAILAPLRDLDEVAYMRFASVYQNYEDLDDFEKAISGLREHSALKAAQAADGDTKATKKSHTRDE